MTPTDIAATATMAAGALYASYRIIMWLATRAIEAVEHLTRWEK
jgi:hypothetical protein